MGEVEAAAADGLPDELVITLRKPVVHGGVSYTEIRLREPTAGEWRQWDKLRGVDADIAGVSIVGGVPQAVVAQIGTRDLCAGSDYLALFLNAGPRTGAAV